MMTCKQRILSEDYLDIPIDFDTSPESLFPGDVTNDDSCTIRISDHLYVLYVAASSMPPLNSAEYRYQYIPKCYGLQNDFSALMQTGILPINKEPLFLTGQGVLIGFVDTGIRYKMPAFLNADGTTRIVSVWDQSAKVEDDSVDNEDAGMEWALNHNVPFGTEYTEEEINRNISEGGPLLFGDESGHATKLISVACGYDLTNGFSGAAPDASIAVVKLKACKRYLRDFYQIPEDVVCFEETDIMLALKYLDELATKKSMPLVICLALGTSMGSHDGSSLLDGYLSMLGAKRNRCVVVGAGNEGNAAGHYECAFDQTRMGDDLYDEAELLVGEYERGFYMEIWGQIPGIYTVSVIAPNGESIHEVPFRLGQSAKYDFIYSESVVYVEYVPVDLKNGQQLIVLRFQAPLSGIWKIRIYGKRGKGKVHMWLPIRQYLKSETYFLKSSPYETITEPAYAKQTLAVTAYNGAEQSFYLNSGRGYAADGAIVPAIAAPGVLVQTVLGAETGASMAAALTAGAAADFLQWAVVEGKDIVVNTSSVKNYFIRGANREDGIIYPSREWGYGTLNLKGVFDLLAGI